MAEPGLFMRLRAWNIGRSVFSVAQAFTPGLDEAYTLRSPLPGGFSARRSTSPLKGGLKNHWIPGSQA